MLGKLDWFIIGLVSGTVVSFTFFASVDWLYRKFHKPPWYALGGRKS